MNYKQYSQQSKKDQFLINKLWKYILDKISNVSGLDEKKRLIDRIATMEIFPYIGDDNEVYFSSLTVVGISWFYLREGELRQERSTKNYRIIAANILPRDIYNKIIGVFGPSANQIGYIQLFSNEIVIRAILEEMRKEKDYTEKWWQSAQDILKLWNRQNPGIAYRIATENISNDYFLFDSEYCPNNIRNRLLEVKVYKDILQHPESKAYFGSIGEMNRNEAMQLLNYFGVPNRFSSGGILSRNLRRLYLGLARQVHFPVQDNKNEQDLCDIAHEILFRIIRNTDYNAFVQTLQDRDLRPGIPIRNINNTFVSVDYSLFFESNVNEERTNEQNNNEINRKLDNLCIKSSRYQAGILRIIATDFENLNQTFGQYHLKNIRATAPEFYAWAWQYTHNNGLSHNILAYFSNLHMKYIPCEYNQFILDVIQNVRNGIEQQYSFDMRFTAQQALSERSRINILMGNQRYQSIRPIVVDLLENINTREIKYQLMCVLTCNSETRTQIEAAVFWNRIYCIHSSKSNDQYVNVYYPIDGEYQPQRILLISNEKEEVVKQILLQYIKDTYDIQIDNIAVVNRDRRQDYLDLTFGIRQFLTEQIEITANTDTISQIIALNDVGNYSTEINLWNQLRASRDAILTSDERDRNHINISVFGWQDFLQEKYRGKCQICGTVTATDRKDNNRFFIHPDRDNSFASMAANMFELCPACHGQMRYGRSKRDLRSITKLANQYISMLSTQHKELDEISLISELSTNGNFSEGFSEPIVCPICIDGKQRQIFFSWEHFLRIAFMFYEEDKDYTYAGEIGDFMQLLRMLTTQE